MSINPMYAATCSKGVQSAQEDFFSELLKKSDRVNEIGFFEARDGKLFCKCLNVDVQISSRSVLFGDKEELAAECVFWVKMEQPFAIEPVIVLVLYVQQYGTITSDATGMEKFGDLQDQYLQRNVLNKLSKALLASSIFSPIHPSRVYSSSSTVQKIS